jgi:nucleotide-binding universal stress UspA family protein
MQDTTSEKPSRVEAGAAAAMYSNIVVGYDGSDYSKAALIETANRVRKNGGKVTLVHAVYFDEEEFGIAPVQHEKRLELGHKLCYQQREKFSSEFGIEMESLVCEGEPPDVVAEVAQGKGADLIALGTHGRKGIKRLLLGSVTSGVIAKAHCDVLVVKRPCTECTGSFRNVLVAYDGSQGGMKSLRRAGRLAKSEGAVVTVMYVIPRYEEMVEFFMTESIRTRLQAEAEKVLDSARGIASEEGFSVAAMIREGRPAETVVDTASRLGVDLVVMGSHGWSGVDKAIIGSTTERVVINATCPVLVAR